MQVGEQTRERPATKLVIIHGAREALDALPSELAQVQARTQAHASQLRQKRVRHAAGLAGQLEAVTAQKRKLMDALKR